MGLQTPVNASDITPDFLWSDAIYNPAPDVDFQIEANPNRVLLSITLVAGNPIYVHPLPSVAGNLQGMILSGIGAYREFKIADWGAIVGYQWQVEVGAGSQIYVAQVMYQPRR
jgi:hypothetical protein